jgi:hypothetical protein
VREEEMLKAEEVEGVAQRLIAHIVRSYAYIYPQEVRKRRNMRMPTQNMSDKAVDCRFDSL